MTAGIYVIINKINGKRYIGSSVNIEKRWAAHRCLLHQTAHHSEYLQNAWDLYGEEVFEFSIIEECLPEQLIGREQYYFDTLHPEYNIAAYAEVFMRGVKRKPLSREHKLKLSQFQKGKKHGAMSEETKLRLSESMKGKPGSCGNTGKHHSKEAKIKMSNAHKGQKSWNNGIKLSDEHRYKLSQSKLGKKRKPYTNETKYKLSIAGKGHIVSAETRHKISMANKGKMPWNKGISK